MSQKSKQPAAAKRRQEIERGKSARRKAKQPAPRPKRPKDAVYQSGDRQRQDQNRQVKELQQALELARDRYMDLYDFAPIAYLTLDGSGIIVEINLPGAMLLGTKRERLVGTPLRLFVLNEDRRKFLDHMQRCRRQPGAVRTELRLKRRQGSPIPIQLASQRPGSFSETRPTYHTTVTDLTGSRRTQQERDKLLARERNASDQSAERDRFVAMVSHELRTPLTPILAAVTALRLDEVPPALRPTIEMIRRNIQLETRLIDDLLDVTRIKRNRMRLDLQTVDLHALARDASAMCEQDLLARRIDYSLELGADQWHVQGDPVRLQQVIWNLLKNAIKFTPEGGRISVATRSAEGQVVLSVTDSGIGIDAALLGRVFDPFEQLSADDHRSAGLGLGLTICKAMMDAHHGTIRADSAGPGKGTTFEIELETVAIPAVGAPAGPGLPRAPTLGRRILLVEDDPDTARVMARLLRHAGHEVRVAGSIQSTLELVRHDMERFDVLISDIGLPDGSGLDLPRRLRCDPVLRTARTIALSGFGDDDDLSRSREAGFEQHLTKPIDFAKLLTAIDELTVEPSSR